MVHTYARALSANGHGLRERFIGGGAPPKEAVALGAAAQAVDTKNELQPLQRIFQHGLTR